MLGDGDEDDMYDVEAARRELDRLDPSDPAWGELQWRVADLLHDRYDDSTDPADLTEALDRAQQAMGRVGDEEARLLADTALMVFDRLRDFPAPGDFAWYIDLLERALALLDPESEQSSLAAVCRGRLARGLMSQDTVTAAVRRRAIALWENSAQCRELDPDTQVDILADLAAALSDQQATRDELLRAVRYGRRAIAIPVDEPESAADVCFVLSNALVALHGRGPDTALLVEAIDVLRAGLAHLGTGHSDYPGYTADLVTLLRRLGRERADTACLAEGYALIRDVALPGAPPGHPDRHLVLQAAGTIAAELGWSTDDAALVGEALDRYREAADLPELEPATLALGLINLATTLRDAADHLDDPELLDEGVRAGERALRLCVEGSQERPAALTATSSLLRDRYLAKGAAGDLTAATELAEQALAETPPAELDDRAVRLTNLGVVLSDRYTERATLPDLDAAIRLYRDALAIPEPVARRVAERRNDLALALRDRYLTSYDEADLIEAAQLGEQALADTPEASSAWPGYATNLGNALIERHEADTARTVDLDRAVRLFADALGKVAGRAADESGFATNLGLALATRAEATRSVDGYREAIGYLERAVAVLPPEHPALAHRNANLSEVHMRLVGLLGGGGDIDAATASAQDAVACAREAVAAGDQDWQLLPALANLAGAYRLLHGLDSAAVSSAEIASTQGRAAGLRQVNAVDRFPQMILWARDLANLGDDHRDAAIAAYRQAVQLAGEVAWIGLSVASRQTLLELMAEALTDAVTFALRAGHHAEALSWADRVRSVLWRQTVHVRSLASAVDAGPLARLRGFTDSDLEREQRRSAAHAAAARLALPIAAPDAYAALRFPGTLVLLVPGPRYSTALLLDGGGDALPLDLPRAAEPALEQQVRALREGLSLLDDPSSTSDTVVRHRVFDCLGWLWDSVAEPIFDELARHGRDVSRLWWSAMGDFALLPLHAAGRYPRKRGQVGRGPQLYPCLTDRAMSAYLPTILDSSASAEAAPDPVVPQLLFVSTEAGVAPLPHAESEYASLRGALRRVPITELLDGAATVAAVRDKLPHHRYLHVAAHGAARDDAVMKSGLHLADGVLSLTDLADASVPDGELAVFLTCDSARGDATLANEALHVAGAAMQAGYREVIAATMPLRDSAAAPITAAVYRAVEEAGQVGESVQRALHDCSVELRRDPNTATDPLSWASLAYFGWADGMARSDALPSSASRTRADPG